MVVAFSLMGFAIAQGGSIEFFLSLPAILIVMGGTLGACLIYYPMSKVLGIVTVVKKAFVAHTESHVERVQHLSQLAEGSRKNGLITLEPQVKEIDDRFFRRCMEMTLDGATPDEVNRVMGRELATALERHQVGADVLSTMGTFAPAMGMIGTLIGLVNMLQGLDNPANIGPAMAVALLSTLYGALLANLVFFPLSGKLRYRSWRESSLREMTLEGVIGIAMGDHPAVLEQKLLSFVNPDANKSADPKDPGNRNNPGNPNPPGEDLKATG
ncbi:MAG: motility protein A [Leptospirillia bacterium]